jgi:predicted NBD/HSP70 family sugar kinase
LSRLGEAAAKVMGVGVVVSGDIDTETGVVRMSPRMNWSDVPLAALLQARLGLPVVVDNDVRALTIAEEWFGIGVDTDSFAIVTIGTGIGCGLYLNGDVVAGAHGVAGEIVKDVPARLPGVATVAFAVPGCDSLWSCTAGNGTFCPLSRLLRSRRMKPYPRFPGFLISLEREIE